MSISDRADELRAMPDLWPEIRRHLVFGYDESELEAKFRKGEAEHGRDWLNMSRDDLTREIQAELLDIALYNAMIRARWPVADPYLANRDPGDEQD